MKLLLKNDKRNKLSARNVLNTSFHISMYKSDDTIRVRSPTKRVSAPLRDASKSAGDRLFNARVARRVSPKAASPLLLSIDA